MARLVDVIGTLGEVSEQETWLDYKQYEYTAKDVTPLLAVIVDYQSYMASDDGASSWKPVHAWRALGQLGLARAIEPLISQFDLLNEDDWAFIELPQVLAMFGAAALPPLAAFLLEPNHDEFGRAMALEALVLLAQQEQQQNQPPQYAELKTDTETAFKAYLQTPHSDELAFNALLVGEVLDLQLLDLQADVEALYSKDIVDLDVCDKAYAQKTFTELAVQAQQAEETRLAQLAAAKIEAEVAAAAAVETEVEVDDDSDVIVKPSNPDDVIGLLDYYLDHYASEDSILSCSELDGFVHAIACAPNVLEHEFWLPLIWGEQCIEPEWEHAYEGKEFPDLVFSVYSHALENLAKGRAEPLFYEPEDDGKSYDVANEWCAGFLRGGALWEEVDEADVELVQAPIDLVKLFATEDGFEVLDAMSEQEVAAKQEEVLDGVYTVYKHFNALRNKPQTREEPKIGRNDPCPCGSGKKFKKCCANK